MISIGENLEIFGHLSKEIFQVLIRGGAWSLYLLTRDAVTFIVRELEENFLPYLLRSIYTHICVTVFFFFFFHQSH